MQITQFLSRSSMSSRGGLMISFNSNSFLFFITRCWSTLAMPFLISIKETSMMSSFSSVLASIAMGMMSDVS